MSPKTFKILSVVAVIAVIASVIVALEKPTVHFAFAKGRPLIQTFYPSEVDGITVVTDDEEVRLDRNGDTFVVSSKLSYPASNKQVNDLMRNCLDITLAAEAATDPAVHEDLGVAEDSDGGKIVRFFDREGKELVGVIVGKTVEGEAGSYVRLASNDTVYRSEESVWIPNEFLDKQILDTKRDDVRRVEVEPSDGPSYVISSPEAGKIELENIPEGKRAKGSAHETVFGATSYLNFDEFEPTAEMESLSFDNKYSITLRDQARYDFEIAVREVVPEGDEAEEGDEDETAAPKEPEKEYWLRGSAVFTGPARITIAEDDEDEELKKKEAMLLAQDAVEAFNKKHQSWVYEIPSWKAQNMIKPFAELVEEVPDRPDEIAASHILIAYEGAERSEVEGRTAEEAKAKAEEIRAEVLADPENFAELAAEHSDGPSKDKGGDLGTFGFDAMSEPFSEAAFQLEVGEVSEVVETEFGFHVIKRTK